MIRKTTVLLLGFSFLAGCISTSGTPEDGTPPEKSLADYQIEMFEAINEARLTPRFCGSAYFVSADSLTYDLRLNQATEEHAWDMASNDFVSKTGSNGSIIEGRLGDLLYDFSGVGEIVYGGSAEVSEAIQSWVADPLR